jgi:hypothetical protein
LFEALTYGYQLRRLQSRKRRTEAIYRKAIEDARASKQTVEQVRSIDSEEMFETAILDDEIAALQTKFLVKAAERTLLPVPTFDVDGPEWQEASTTGRWHLSVEARAALRRNLRVESKERWELWYRWIPLVTGLLGTLIGLVSVFKR